MKIAVIGGGIAGISSAHFLERTGRHAVTLFESSAELGGHAHAVMVPTGHAAADPRIAVDTAFLIYNRAHYPNFVALLRELGVEGDGQTQAAEMSASFVDWDRKFHYSLGRGFDATFAQRRNLVSPRFHAMFVELLAFRYRALADLRANRIPVETTLGEYLARHSRRLVDCFIVPLACAIWSLPGDLVLSYPALHILQFFDNHRLLEGNSGDAWRTFGGSSRVYVDAFHAGFRGEVRLGRAVRSVTRASGAVDVAWSEAGAPRQERFDRVVLATHADVSLALLAAPTPQERAVLGAFRYHANTVVLHEDETLLHPDRRLWASWNVVTRDRSPRATYWLNRVQRLRSQRTWLLTLGDAGIDERRIFARFSYRHPIFDAAAVTAQRGLAALNADAERTVTFAGSYGGHGFHEDAVVTAQAATRALCEPRASRDDGAARRAPAGSPCPA